jgi:hypothetical protein
MTRTPPWLSIATPSALRSASTSEEPRCAGSRSARPTSLYPPAATPGLTDDERRIIAEMMAKGTYGMLLLATKDLDDTFERLQVGSQTGQVEVVQEPTEQPYGVRDCALRDPAGNMVRIQELR